MTEVSTLESVANTDVERQLDEQAARQGRPSPLDVAFLASREGVTELLLIRHAHQHLDLSGPIGAYLDGSPVLGCGAVLQRSVRA